MKVAFDVVCIDCKKVFAEYKTIYLESGYFLCPTCYGERVLYSQRKVSLPEESLLLGVVSKT